MLKNVVFIYQISPHYIYMFELFSAPRSPPPTSWLIYTQRKFKLVSLNFLCLYLYNCITFPQKVDFFVQLVFTKLGSSLVSRYGTVNCVRVACVRAKSI